MSFTSVSSSTPQRLGDFEIVRELGRGGMGVVYEARQLSLNRKVALKVLASSLGLSSRAIERFRREAEAAAKLHHTNIVPVYATGEQDDIHFYAMELIAGPSLDHVIKQLREPNSAATTATLPQELAQTGPYVASASPPSSSPSGLSSLSGSGSGYFDTVARLLAEVADALEHAHKQGVIHRDIKPSNLLLSPDGKLSLNDFGLARMLEQPGMTMTGEFVGTPAYMSPEQVTSGRVPLDHRTDIYSLGATLYELLTFHPPFVGDRRDQVLAQIIQTEPRSPRSWNKQIPRDLETICLKALDKNPARRYQTAGQMADDLRRFVKRFAISAKRAGPLKRLTKWVRRHPALTLALGVAFLAIGVAGLFAYQAHDAELRHEAALRQIEEQRLDEKRQNAIDKAYVAAMSGDADEAKSAIAEAERLGVSPGQVRMLNGQVALQSGNTATALRELEQAVLLLPRSVAARALLGLAHMENNDIATALADDQAEIAKLEPVTADDYLFLGQFEALADPQRGLAFFNEAVRRRNSPIIRLIRGEARAHHAMDTADPADAAAAVEDAVFARQALPDNPTVLSVNLYAQLIKALVCRRRGLTKESDEAMAQAGRNAQALEPFPASAMNLQRRCFYFDYAGEKDRGLKLARSGHDRGDAYADMNCALFLVESGNYAGARDLFEQDGPAKEQPWYLTGRAFLRAMQGDASPMRVRAPYDQAARLPRSDAEADLYAQTVLRLLGPKHKAEALAVCRQLLERRSHWPPAKRTWYLKLLDYNCGLCSANELLAEAGTSHWSLCEAHFFIAMTCLADGDRRGAVQHFEAAVNTDVFLFNEHIWSRLLLARMKQDENWPPWLSEKE